MKKEFKKSEDILRDLLDNIKSINMNIKGVPEGEEREEGLEKLFEEIMAENTLHLGKETDIQVQETQRVPNKMNPKKNTPRYIILKMVKVKDKERTLKAAREKQLITYKGNHIRLSADISAENLQVRREWHDIFKVLKGKNFQP